MHLCTPSGKRDFINWFKNIHMPDSVNWLLVGDFNLYRSPADRNKPRGDHVEMYIFNEPISALGLVELPLMGRRFTWSNKQLSPLLERLDGFFTSAIWTVTYPNTFVSSLVMETSDHTPCVISISTVIPKKSNFRFENFWMEHQEFIPLVQQAWSAPTPETDAAKIITSKFKNLRKVLKDWQRNLSNLKLTIENVKLVLTFFLYLEEFRDLSIPEWNFKKILEQKLSSLLRQQHIYWKQRGSIKWITLCDASTKFFHANASMRFRRNLITSLETAEGCIVTDHNAKAKLIWDSFKERLGFHLFRVCFSI